MRLPARPLFELIEIKHLKLQLKKTNKKTQERNGSIEIFI